MATTMSDGVIQIDNEDLEFTPLPLYTWAERPWTVPLTLEEASTALHLSHGSIPGASGYLRVPEVRFNRFLRRSPALRAVLEEALEVVAVTAEAVPIETLFDSGADARRREWASTQVRQMRYFQGRAMSPAASGSGNVTITSTNQEILYTWGPHEGDTSVIEHE